MKGYNYHGGQAALTAVIFFLVISLALVAGSVQPVLSEFRITRGLLYSVSAWLLAESGIEDVTYRLRQGYSVTSPAETPFGTATSTITITAVDSTHKNLSATGTVESYVRKVFASVASTSGFGYTWSVETSYEVE